MLTSSWILLLVCSDKICTVYVYIYIFQTIAYSNDIGRIMVELKDIVHDSKGETTGTIYQMKKRIA